MATVLGASEPQWFRKTRAELQALFDGCSFTFGEIARIVIAVRDGDFCEAKSLEQGWKLYVERCVSKRTQEDLCRLIAAWAMDATALHPATPCRKPGVWDVSTTDARALLASAFWGNLMDPTRKLKDARNGGGLSFARIYDGPDIAAEKWACLFCYFDQAADGVSGCIRFERVVGEDPCAFLERALKMKDSSKLVVNVHQDGMECVEAEGIMNFANKNFGYGKIIPSATQEEVLQMCFPEFNVGMLVFGQIEEDEVVLVRNVQRFSKFVHPGVFVGLQDCGDRMSVLTADACLKEHFSEYNNGRDLQKAYLAFGAVRSASSGRWGCGVFGGDVQHKFLQQIIAARLAGLERLHFSAYHDRVMFELCDDLAQLCTQRTVAELVHVLKKHSELMRSEAGPRLTVVQCLKLVYPATQRNCVLLNHGSFNPVHQCHIEMMKRAKLAVELAGYVVVKACLAPTSPDYIAFKANRNPRVLAVAEEVRVEALALAVEPHSWLEVDWRGKMAASGENMLRYTIAPELVAFGEVVYFNVVGADVAWPKKHGLPTICIDRGPSPGLEAFIAEQNKARADLNLVPHIYVQELAGGQVSSTAVRDALLAKSRVDVDRLCGPAVADLLWRAQVGGTLWTGSRTRWVCSRRPSRESAAFCRLL